MEIAARGTFNYRGKGTRAYLHSQLGFLYFNATFKGHREDDRCRRDGTSQILVSVCLLLCASVAHLSEISGGLMGVKSVPPETAADVVTV